MALLHNLMIILTFLFWSFRIRNYMPVSNARILFLYIFLASLFSVHILSHLLFSLFSTTMLLKVNYWTYFLHAAILSFFILRIEKPLMKSRFIYFAVCCWLSILLIVMLVGYYDNHVAVIAMSVCGLLLLCIYYFFALFKNDLMVDFLRDFNFWIVAGVFVGMSTCVPWIAARAFLENAELGNDSPYHFVRSLGGIGYVLMYIMFIKGITCLSVKVPT